MRRRAQDPRLPHHAPTAALALAVLAAAGAAAPTLAAQKDLRDTVTLRNGRTLHGRVSARYEPDEVWLQQGGSRQKIPRERIRSIVTVNDHLRAWLAARTQGLTVAREWELATEAERLGLHAMARLQALHVLLRDPGHEAAHRFLDHVERRDGPWMWRLGPEPDGDLVPRERFDEHHADPGHPLELRTEHHVLRTTAGLRHAVDLAFDLERLYLAWMDEFGERVRAREVLVPMTVWAYADVEDFPRLSTEPRPYYEPGTFLDGGIGGDNVVYTFFEDVAAPDGQVVTEPEEAFENATRQLIYSTLVTERGLSGGRPQQRLGAWLEIGLGAWFGRRMQGPPGYATLRSPQPPVKDAEVALQDPAAGSLRMAESELTNLIGLRYGQFYEVRDEVPQLWAKSRAFVAFLMDDDTMVRDRRGRRLGSGRDAVMRYLLLAWHEGKGHSSSRVDEALFDTRVEWLTGPWQQWLQEVAAGKRD